MRLIKRYLVDFTHSSHFCYFCLCWQLTDGGKASKAKISVGDTVLSIDGITTEGMTHLEAQNKIKACTGNLNLTLQK